MSVEAFRMPFIIKAVCPSHGPKKSTSPNLKVPFGTYTLPLPFHSHASFHAFKNAFRKQQKQLPKQEKK